MPLEQVATEYLQSGFLIDLLAFIPFGLVFSYMFNDAFRVFWVMKLIRLKDLYFYTSMAFFQPMIDFHIERKQKAKLDDKEKRYEKHEDLIYINEKIYLKNFFKVLKLILQTLFIVFFVG